MTGVDKGSELDQLKRATTMAFGALVKALEESQPGLAQRFVKNVEEHYNTVRHEPTATALHAMEMLSWISTVVKADNKLR
jgi:carboxylesterase type B